MAAAQRQRGPRRSGVLWAAALGAALLFAGFMALGLWQVQRLSWKEALIERVNQRLQAAPEAAPGPAGWAGIDKARDEYRRLTLRGTFDHTRAVRVQASTVLGSGHWVLTPLRTEAGWWVWVNRGFVPPRGAVAEPAGEQRVEGLLRLSEPGGSLLQHNDPASGRWYSRDVAALAAAAQLPASGPVAPYFVDEGRPDARAAALMSDAEMVTPTTTQQAAGPWPRPGLTVVHFSNNHRVYALTWFAMAAMVAGIAAWLWRDARRRPR